jgi:hypothetical protein
MMRFNALGTLCLCAFVAACSGSSVPTTSQPAKIPTATAKGTASLRIVVPSASVSNAVTRKPAYVSPSTASIVIAVDSVNGVAESPVPTQEVDITASNTADCVPPTALAPLTCTVPISAPVGTDVLTLTTYDQTGGLGNELSINSISATITQGTTNNISVTLAGVVAALVAVPVTGLNATGGSPNAFTMTGATAQVLVEALDADSNVIIGPGAPVMSIQSVSPANITASMAAATGTNPNPNPNLVNLTKIYGSASSAQITYAATPPQNPSPPTSTGAGGATTSVLQVIAPVNIYVADNAEVQQFIPPNTSATAGAATGSGTTATQLGHDGTGREYAVIPGQTEIASWSGGSSFAGSAETYVTGEPPVAMAVAQNGALAFIEYSGVGTTVFYYPPGASGFNYTQYFTPSSIRTGPVSAAFDPTGTTLYLATTAGIFKTTNVPSAPSSAQLSSTYTSGQIATDAAGNVFINDGTSGVLAFAPTNFSTPAATYALPANCNLSGATVTESSFAVGGSSLATDTVIVQAEYTDTSINCWAYASYPTAVSGSTPSTFSAASAVFAVTGGGQVVLGTETEALDVYSSLWGSASYSATAGGSIAAIDAF